MRVHFRGLILLVSIAVLVSAPSANGPVSIGAGSATTVLPLQQRACPGDLIHNHDGSFENGYAWDGPATAPPIGGAFGESYDLGGASIHCAVFWLTRVGTYTAPNVDLYIWEGGISGEPGAVLYVRPGYHFDAPAFWPQFSQHEIAITAAAGLAVSGEFTVGFYVDHTSSPPQFFIAADEDNAEGHPWTYAAPSTGYPTGWMHPGIVWGAETLSLGIGLTVERSTAGVEEDPQVTGATWGRIRELFRR